MPPPAALRTPADPFRPPPFLLRKRTLALLAVVLMAASYAVTLIATVPARSALHFRDVNGIVTDASGTVWHGDARIGAAHDASWHFLPLVSLASASLVWRARFDGADTALTANISVRGSRTRFTRISGAAGWSLFSLAGSAAPAICELSARVTSGEIIVTRRGVFAEGEAVSAPSSCRTQEGEVFDLPGLSLRAEPGTEGTRIVINRGSSDGETLAELVLGPEGAAELVLTGEGAKIFRNGP